MGYSNTTLDRIWLVLGLALALSSGASACKDDDGGNATNQDDTGGSATETNVQPAPCEDDGDCPPDIECVFATDDADVGFCNVNDVDVNVDGGVDAGTDAGGATTSAAPAPCEDETDCPDGIACVHPSGSDGPGFCDVEEMSVTPSMGAAAPCVDDSECPEGIACVKFDESGPGFCDVNEMIEP